MPSSHRVCKISSVLLGAPTASLIDELRAALGVHFAATGADVLLVDYRTATLRPVGAEWSEMPIDSSPHGRVFAAQEPLADERGRVLLPVTARGSRLGVLEVWLPEPPKGPDLEELAAVAPLLGYALKLADQETDRFQRARRRQRLTMPAEIQWDLLPPASFAHEGFELGAQLEPAYAIAGDHFDWAINGRHLTLSVTNGMGNGIQAALLTVLAVGSLRNARRSGADLAEQAGLANDAIHARYGGQEFVETLLLQVDTQTGEVAAVDAGSPLLLRSAGGADQRQAAPFERLELEQQLPLGMFSGTEYVPQRFKLERGDRLLAVSDGLHGALSPGGDRFGDRALERAARASRRISAAEAVRALIRDLVTYHEGEQLRDDAVAVCLDWTH